MARYRVTPQLYPGVYRQGEGFFHVDQEFEMPDDEVPHHHLEPLDEAAQSALKKHHNAERPLAGALPPKKKGPGDTIREAAKAAGLDAGTEPKPAKTDESKGKRAADK